MVAEGETYIPEEELEGDLAFQHVQVLFPVQIDGHDSKLVIGHS